MMVYEPLFQPGIHEVSLRDIKDICVAPFVSNSKRAELLSRFEAYLIELGRIGLNLWIWVDGSFVTTKPVPGDIDIVVFFQRDDVENLNDGLKAELSLLLNDKIVIRLRYGIDVYCASVEDTNQRMYWRGCYGFVKETEEPKGIPQIKIEGCDEPNSMA